ncbi:hypothetical protein GCM10009760_30100 [Kitasatospora kazusensis]|uniref:Uncharacterized protein n=1 Tax=Kitasatospora kazusensis TaxID=407974 RepID=A0ABP5L8V1_9ACTN
MANEDEAEIKRALGIAGAAIALGAVFVGARIMGEGKDGPEGRLEA